MFDDVDQTLEKLLEIEFGTPLPFDLSFAVPDKNFRPVSGNRATLNCFLYDIRENRDLRRAEPQLSRTADGKFERKTPAARIRLSYCITAWSPAPAGGAVQSPLEEHRLLGQVLEKLFKYPELPGAALRGVLARQPLPLPTTLVLPEDMKSNRDFWNAIGGQMRPALDLSITTALDYDDPLSVPQVTLLQSRVGDDAPRFVIRGTVRGAPDPQRPLADVWIRVQETGQTVISDRDGWFVIENLSPGACTLTARAVGFRERRQLFRIPITDGSVDLSLVPL